jgi:hypothetical protein
MITRNARRRCCLPSGGLARPAGRAAAARESEGERMGEPALATLLARAYLRLTGSGEATGAKNKPRSDR